MGQREATGSSSVEGPINRVAKQPTERDTARSPFVGPLNGAPSVSVVVPFYGHDVSALLKCVASLLEQDYPGESLTIVIVDNNETATLAPSSFEGRCRLVHEPSPGSYAARNRGIGESSGDILAFTDSDCVAHRSWVSAGVRVLMEASTPVMVGGPIVFSFGDDLRRTTCEILDSIIHHRQNEYVTEHRFAATANLFVLRTLICRHGQFDARFHSAGDREFGQRLAGAGIGIVIAQDAIVLHPARSRFIDLWQKALRGVGGQATALSIRKSPWWLIFPMQARNYLHRRRLISDQSQLQEMTPWQLIKLQALLIFIYLARLFEAIRLVLGGRPNRR